MQSKPLNRSTHSRGSSNWAFRSCPFTAGFVRRKTPRWSSGGSSMLPPCCWRRRHGTRCAKSQRLCRVPRPRRNKEHDVSLCLEKVARRRGPVVAAGWRGGVGAVWPATRSTWSTSTRTARRSHGMRSCASWRASRD